MLPQSPANISGQSCALVQVDANHPNLESGGQNMGAVSTFSKALQKVAKSSTCRSSALTMAVMIKMTPPSNKAIARTEGARMDGGHTHRKPSRDTQRQTVTQAVFTHCDHIVINGPKLGRKNRLTRRSIWRKAPSKDPRGQAQNRSVTLPTKARIYPLQSLNAGSSPVRLLGHAQV